MANFVISSESKRFMAKDNNGILRNKQSQLDDRFGCR